ncbi:Uncharacterised protein [Vibrio cholerae]|nr:Uncharacterised protein [Vibrio cholerae]
MWRPSSPFSTTTEPFATLHSLARYLLKCALALPSIGGAVMATLSSSPCRPTMLSRLALG